MNIKTDLSVFFSGHQYYQLEEAIIYTPDTPVVPSTPYRFWELPSDILREQYQDFKKIMTRVGGSLGWRLSKDEPYRLKLWTEVDFNKISRNGLIEALNLATEEARRDLTEEPPPENVMGVYIDLREKSARHYAQLEEILPANIPLKQEEVDQIFGKVLFKGHIIFSQQLMNEWKDWFNSFAEK